MIRTQIQLTEEQASALREMAADEGISMAELIRRSVEATLRSRHTISLEERRRRALALAGRFSGPPDLAARHDDYFAEACAEKDDENRR